MKEEFVIVNRDNEYVHAFIEDGKLTIYVDNGTFETQGSYISKNDARILINLLGDYVNGKYETKPKLSIDDCVDQVECFDIEFDKKAELFHLTGSSVDGGSHVRINLDDAKKLRDFIDTILLS